MYVTGYRNALKKCKHEQQSTRPVATRDRTRHQARTILGNSTERVNIYWGYRYYGMAKFRKDPLAVPVSVSIGFRE
jgi:hypothetical protein